MSFFDRSIQSVPMMLLLIFSIILNTTFITISAIVSLSPKPKVFNGQALIYPSRDSIFGIYSYQSTRERGDLGAILHNRHF